MKFRVVARGGNGEIQHYDFSNASDISARYDQVTVEDCSTYLELRGFPVYRGLIGPMPDGDGVARYETPEVFEELTKIWGAPRRKRRHKNDEPISIG